MGWDESDIDGLLAAWEEARARGDSTAPEVLCPGPPELTAELSRRIHLLEACDRLLDGEANGPAPPVPDRIGAYEVRGEIGRGGMGVVYRAWDPGLCREVALKVVRPTGPADAYHMAVRFRREGQVLARLRHESIVPVYAAEMHDDRPYFVMEYVPGGSLADWRTRLITAGPAAIAAFLERVTRAVAYVHTHNVLHRDLKPSNILVDNDGRPRVGDFGLAKLWDPGAPAEGAESAKAAADETAVTGGTLTHLTASGHQPGTWTYMAPEQFDPTIGPVGPAADIWALGVILYELLAGRKPFPGPSRTAVCRQVRHDFPALQSSLSPARRHLARIVRRCLEKDPARRYPSATALADDLRRAARARWRVAFAAASLLAVAVVGGVAAFNPKVAPPPPPDWWHDRPPVHAALNRLREGEEVTLVGGGRQVEFDWATGPASGQAGERADGAFVIRSDGPVMCLVELLPYLPPDRRYHIDVTLRHESGDGHSWAVVYAAGTRCTTAAGWGTLTAAARFADLGLARTHGAGLVAQYVGESRGATYDYVISDPGAPPVAKADDQPHLPDSWRQLVLVVDANGVSSAVQGIVGGVPLAKLQLLRQKIAPTRPDLSADVLPANPLGAVGVAAFKGVVAVRHFRVTPVPFPNP